MYSRVFGGGGSGGGIIVSDTPPIKTNVLWIDTSSGGMAKYYDGANWVSILAVSVWT